MTDACRGKAPNYSRWTGPFSSQLRERRGVWTEHSSNCSTDGAVHEPSFTDFWRVCDCTQCSVGIRGIWVDSSPWGLSRCCGRHYCLLGTLRGGRCHRRLDSVASTVFHAGYDCRSSDHDRTPGFQRKCRIRLRDRRPNVESRRRDHNLRLCRLSSPWRIRSGDRRVYKSSGSTDRQSQHCDACFDCWLSNDIGRRQGRTCFSGQTVRPGAHAVTVYGQVVSLAANNSLLVVGSSTQTLHGLTQIGDAISRSSTRSLGAASSTASATFFETSAPTLGGPPAAATSDASGAVIVKASVWLSMCIIASTAILGGYMI